MRKYDKYNPSPDKSQFPKSHEKMIRAFGRMCRKSSVLWAKSCNTKNNKVAKRLLYTSDRIFQQEYVLFLKMKELYPVWLSGIKEEEND
jgi:hypothetical protein